MTDNDVTSGVEFDEYEGGVLSMTRCACGKEWKVWDFVLGQDRNRPDECPQCHRKLYFKLEIKVYEVGEE